MDKQLHAVADAENRLALLEHVVGQARCIRFIDAGRSAGQDKAAWCEILYQGLVRIVAENLTVNSTLAHASSDELAVLGAKIQYSDCFILTTREGFSQLPHLVLFTKDNVAIAHAGDGNK